MAKESTMQEASNPSQQSESKGTKQQLGPFLCWAVVFADIGTSIYYVPGILYGTVGKLSGFFVFLTMVVFILLTLKYVEVTYRFPQGGGVVTVSAQALNKWFGALGGMFILVDYFLTAAISCLSGMLYLSVVVPALGPQSKFLGLGVTLWITLLILVSLGILNWVGVSESAKVSMVGAVIAFASDVAILVTVFTHISFPEFLALFPKMFVGQHLTLATFLVGFAGSFLAFSGLESISQLAPEMKLPRRFVGKLALFLVVLTVGLTSPLLTMLSTLLEPKAAADAVQSAQIISLLGGRWGGAFLQTEVAISASALLIFAGNTAIIGSYHVFLALSRMEFFPEIILRRNKLRGTPHYSIALSTLIPIIVLILVAGNINILGDMYAFGLLGAFTLTCFSMDIVRYRTRKARKKGQEEVAQNAGQPTREQKTSAKDTSESVEDKIEDRATEETTPTAEQPEREGRWTRSTLNFWLGILTTLLVVTAWSTNLISKPLATAFGGSVSVLGMGIAYINYSRHKKKGRVPVLATQREQPLPGSVLAVLIPGPEHNKAVIAAAVKHGEHTPVTFLYIGERSSTRKPESFRLTSPHLGDAQAKEDFGRANHMAQEAKVPSLFVYRHMEPHAVQHVWQVVHPADMIIAAEHVSDLKGIEPDQIRYEDTDAGKVAHLLKQW
ncbi:MAG: hypothetical protein NVS4B11_00900 [Ktedonobacteraceae bacterium]